MRKLKKESWPYKVTVPGGEETNMEIWLDNNIGVYSERWNIVVDYKVTDYYFKFPQDMILFSLRWQ